MTFTTKPITLASQLELSAVLEIRNLQDVRDQMHNNQFISVDSHSHWCEVRKKEHGGKGCSFLVHSAKSNAVVGFYRYWYDETYSAGNWSMFTDLRSSEFGLGFYCEISALKNFFQSTINLNGEIVSEVKEGNGIIGMHKKCGFEVESASSDGFLLMRNTEQRFSLSCTRMKQVLQRLGL